MLGFDLGGRSDRDKSLCTGDGFAYAPNIASRVFDTVILPSLNDLHMSCECHLAPIGISQHRGMIVYSLPFIGCLQ